jgi:hypothetical protein
MFNILGFWYSHDIMTYSEKPVTVHNQEHVEKSSCDNATLACCNNATIEKLILKSKLLDLILFFVILHLKYQT